MNHDTTPVRTSTRRKPSETMALSSPYNSRSSSNPNSALLQDMIKEKRAQTQRASRTRDASSRTLNGARHELDDRDVQSSPLTAMTSRERPGQHVRRGSGMATKAPPAPKDMGLREMQEHVSKINKQNFDLKLEIFHRRQRNEVLESRVEKFEALAEENEDLRATNDDLVLQIEKRDNDIAMREAAIEEAVGMICHLEARIDDLEKNLKNDSRPVSDGVPYPWSLETPSITPATPPRIRHASQQNENSPNHPARETAQHADMLTTTSSRSPLRQPSFLRENKRSTAALRSLYSTANPSFATLQRPSSFFSDEEFDEDMDRQLLNSPRLSILSESGFSSIYGNLREKTASPQLDTCITNKSSASEANNGPSQRIAQREARISDWVEESQRVERPKTPLRRSPKPSANDRFSSIGEVLRETPSVLKENDADIASPQSHKSAVSSNGRPNEQRFQKELSPTKSLRKSARAHERLSSRAGSLFGGSHLPPTPDTMSTATVGGSSSTQSIITEKSMVDGALVPANGYATIVQRERPQSSDSKFGYQFSKEVGFYDGAVLETSDEELESTKVERSELGSRSNEAGFPEAPSFIGRSVKATRFFGDDVPVRPSLTTHTTDLVLSGEGYPPKQPSRTLSYPSPTGSSRRASNQLASSNKRSSGVPSERTITSPTRSSPTQARSSASLQSTERLSYDAAVQTERDGKHPRGSSLRFRLPRMPSTNPTGNQSVTSRIFRRSNHQTTNTLPRTQDANLPQPVSRPARPSLPRPSSLYGQPSPPSSLKSMLPTAMLTDLNRLAARPGTSDGADEPAISNRDRQRINMRRYSAVVDDSVVDLVQGAASLSHVHGGGNLQHKKSDNGLTCVVEAESGLRRVSETRQTLRGDDESRQGKWGLGRNASAKIWEGLGLRR
ncbi:MAG: hypothetical protein Q9217_006282 [Psora testacea]